MIEEYYNGVVEQVYSRLGESEQNIIMVQYSNDFSIANLAEMKDCEEKRERIYPVYYEFHYQEITCGYEPFLAVIFKLFQTYGRGHFSEFLRECGVYVPHREILESYYETGRCTRTEMVLLDEVAYEQRRMTEAVAAMLRKAAEYCPVLVVINRFQLASRSSIELVNELIQHPSANIGMVLGVNEKPANHEDILKCWDTLVEKLEDSSLIYHLGNSEIRRGMERRKNEGDYRDFESIFQELSNTVALLDYEQASWYIQDMIHKIKFEDERLSDERKMQFYPLYVQVSVLNGDFARAMELITVLGQLKIVGKENLLRYVTEYSLAMCQMYQGKLESSYEHAMYALEAAEYLEEDADKERKKLEAELLAVQAQMAGWHNFFFCLKDMEIPEEFLDRLMQYGYKNNLAHIYIYAFGNSPEEAANVSSNEPALSFFYKGVSLAEEIGNERLVYHAYQKNIMIAATNGYYEAALVYLLKNYRHEKDKHSMECGRTYSSIGYNLSALGQSRLAEIYYHKAIRLFFENGLPEDIAEVHYNMSLNCIMENDFSRAEHYLQLCMKTIEKLRMNSLRVCNLSKLYGLMAFVSIMQGNRFNCRRYLLNSGQFLDYVVEKKNNQIQINHDYAKVDDDLFLYWFSKALLAQSEGEKEAAYAAFRNADTYMRNAKSNQFYAYRIFCEKRMELFRSGPDKEPYREEEALCNEYLHKREQNYARLPREVLLELSRAEGFEEELEEFRLEALVKQESLTRELKKSRRQMEFMSSWQKVIDVTDQDMEQMTEKAMKLFLNQFGNDGAMYIRYNHRVPRVIYNDTGAEMTEERFAAIERLMREYPQGFAVSKISGNFLDHLDMIAYFGEQEICSLAAVPFFKNGRLESAFITYILMKENWHSFMESYRISEEDLPVYQLLFRELGYSINRLEAYEKIFEMNQKLSRAATTDSLTGLYNRAGFYREIELLAGRIRRTGTPCSLAVMFIDLDNFKPYNDTYGHYAGDIVLQSMAEIFCEVFGKRGIVGRYGGDEFLVLLEETDRHRLKRDAEEIYGKLKEKSGFSEEISRHLGQAVVIDTDQRITCSIGIAVRDGIRTEEDINCLIKEADNILYSIKENGKGTYAFAK